jgi:hypothetical protein
MERISKACDPCRARKTRCNGEEPCGNCRKKPAPRSATPGSPITHVVHQNGSIPLASRPAVVDMNAVSATEREVDSEASAAQRKVYHGVMASHPITAQSTEALDHCQLFYGPSSHFAFIQQVYKDVLLSHPHGQQGDRDVQEGGPGLDMFMQRSIFFGASSRVDPVMLARLAITPIRETLPLSEAQIFLDHFKATSYYLFPFYSTSELDQLLHRLYSDEPETSALLQIRALVLAMLADGALCTDRTEVAETLLARAKQQVVLFDDAVSLVMIQYALIAADYQLHMGRPNSAYIQIGNAVRKAVAMGLHKESPRTDLRQDSTQKQRTTLWCLYFHEV